MRSDEEKLVKRDEKTVTDTDRKTVLFLLYQSDCCINQIVQLNNMLHQSDLVQEKRNVTD